MCVRAEFPCIATFQKGTLQRKRESGGPCMFGKEPGFFSLTKKSHWWFLSLEVTVYGHTRAAVIMEDALLLSSWVGTHFSNTNSS